MKFSKIKFSELEKGKRLDAEYYSPEFLEVETAINIHPEVKPLRKLVEPVKTGFPFQSFMFSERGEVPLVRIRDIQPTGISMTKPLYIPKKLAEAHPEAIPKVGDLVIGLDGDEFRSSIIAEDLGLVSINQRIAIISTRKITPEYLLAFLNSKYGSLQLFRKKTTATTVGHISPRDVRNLLVIMAPDEIRKRITHIVKESIRLRKEADKLWHDAIDELEAHIENGVQGS